MKHYVLTRAYRNPEYPIEANRRRVEVLRRVTAPSLAAQPVGWEWIVYIDETDPLLMERLDAFQSAGVPVLPVPIGHEVPIDWSGPVLTTRIDDDDAFAIGAFERIRASAANRGRRTVLMLPNGHRVCGGKVMPVRHGRNAWASLYAPQGDRTHVRAIAHIHLDDIAPIRYISNMPGWLWVRHQDAETGFRRATDAITDEVRHLYAVDWEFLEGLE